MPLIIFAVAIIAIVLIGWGLSAAINGSNPVSESTTKSQSEDSKRSAAQELANEMYVDNHIVKKIADDHYAYMFIPKYKHDNQVVSNKIKVTLYSGDGQPIEPISFKENGEQAWARVDARTAPPTQGGNIEWFSYTVVVDGYTFDSLPKKFPITSEFGDDSIEAVKKDLMDAGLSESEAEAIANDR